MSYGLNFVPNRVKGITLYYTGPDSQPLKTLRNQIPQEVQGIQIKEWPVFYKSTKDIPIRTSGMCNCVAFIIQSKHRHYMMHLNPITNQVNEIEKHLRKDFPTIQKDSVKLFIVTGCLDRTERTAQALLQALTNINPELVDRVQYRHFPEKAIDHGPTEDIDSPLAVVSYNGELYYMSNRSRKAKFIAGGSPISPRIQPIDI